MPRFLAAYPCSKELYGDSDLLGATTISSSFSESPSLASDEAFITARGSSGKWHIAWSFYASAVGSWVIVAVPDYGFYAGMIGAVMYAFAAGLPVLLVASWGNHIQRRFPRVLSLSDFAQKRFGPITQTMVVSITLFNMAIGTCAEYTTIASLFGSYVGLGDYDVFMVILLAVVTLSYTTYGGLRVSILSDRIQAITSVLLVVILAIYITATFRIDDEVYERLDRELSKQLQGRTEAGYSSILVFPLSLTTATIYSEAMWQRVWASESPQSLRFGSIVAFCMIFAVVLLFGITGIIGG
jgi:Na+/proline symporter